jgi:AcrR family transcriptional regulator
MAHESPFAGEPTDTRERIMRATLQTLGKHGYAGISIQRIADEADLSKSSVYHFFDSKDDLMLSFLDYMLERFQLPLQVDPDASATEALWGHLEFALYGKVGTFAPPGALHADFDPGSGEPYVELRAQGAHDEAYRERFTGIDEMLQARLAGVIRDGMETGEFREVDPERTSELLLTTMLGGLFRRATSEVDELDVVYEEVQDLVESRLLVESEEQR